MLDVVHVPIQLRDGFLHKPEADTATSLPLKQPNQAELSQLSQALQVGAHSFELRNPFWPHLRFAGLAFRSIPRAMLRSRQT